MKTYLLVLFCFFLGTTDSSANDLESYAGNYRVIGRNALCDHHIEVSGNKLYVSEVLLPLSSLRQDTPLDMPTLTPTCEGSNIYCDGETSVYSCNGNTCSSDTYSNLRLELLRDGNIAFPYVGQKFIRTNWASSEFYTCTKH